MAVGMGWLRKLVAPWRGRRTLDDALAEALYRGLRHDEAKEREQIKRGEWPEP